MMHNLIENKRTTLLKEVEKVRAARILMHTANAMRSYPFEKLLLRRWPSS